MKIVINSCHGGFGLSQKALKYIYDLDKNSKSIELITPEDYFVNKELPKNIEEYFNKQLCRNYYCHKDNIIIRYRSAYESIEPRMCPNLIKCIEELKDDANGAFAKLKIVDVPDIHKIEELEICEYDGIEHVAVISPKYY